MGYYNILKYFIRRLFSFLRSITGKLFVIFVLLFAVLILYMHIDDGVFGFTGDFDYSGEDNKILLNNMHYVFDYAESLRGSDIDFDKYVVIYTKYDYRFALIIFNKNYGEISLSGNQIRLKGAMILNCFADGGASGSTGNNFLRVIYDSDTNVEQNLSFDNFYTNSYSNVFGGYSNTVIIYSSFDTGSFSSTHKLDLNNLPLYFTNPYIENESSTINNWSFDYLKINSGSEGYVYDNPITGSTSYAVLNLKYTYNGITYTQQISSGYIANWSTDNFIVEFPRTSLLNSVNIENGKSVDFYLEIKKDYVSDIIYSLGSYTFSLTTEEQEQIQSDSDKAVQGVILQTQQETNNKLDNLDNTINDSSIDNITSDTLPSDSTSDITADGVNGIFTSIYNAFCVGNAQDIVFPIPFTDKNITLSANYLYNSLTNANASFVITIIQAFWWYIISRFIIKDIMNKINKIKSGNIEDIETNNIRGDML